MVSGDPGSPPFLTSTLSYLSQGRTLKFFILEGHYVGKVFCEGQI